MKTQIAILLLMTSMIFVFGCQKASQTKKPFSKLNTQEQKTIIQKISNDADWELITKSNVDFMNKLVSSNIDIQKINLTDLDGLLAATGIERSEYLNTISKVKAAANRLSQKYNIDNSNVGDISCESCKQTAEEKMTTLKSIVLNFKTNKNAFQNYNQLLTKKITSSAIGRSAVESDEVEGDESDWCCNWQFYGCCLFCAATVEAFPLYLLCCYYCGLSFCCPQWLGKGSLPG